MLEQNVPRTILRAESLFDRGKTTSLRDKIDEFVKGFPALKYHQKVIEKRFKKQKEETKKVKTVTKEEWKPPLN